METAARLILGAGGPVAAVTNGHKPSGLAHRRAVPGPRGPTRPPPAEVRVWADCFLWPLRGGVRSPPRAAPGGTHPPMARTPPRRDVLPDVGFPQVRAPSTWARPEKRDTLPVSGAGLWCPELPFATKVTWPQCPRSGRGRTASGPPRCPACRAGSPCPRPLGRPPQTHVRESGRAKDTEATGRAPPSPSPCPRRQAQDGPERVGGRGTGCPL